MLRLFRGFLRSVGVVVTHRSSEPLSAVQSCHALPYIFYTNYYNSEMNNVFAYSKNSSVSLSNVSQRVWIIRELFQTKFFLTLSNFYNLFISIFTRKETVVMMVLASIFFISLIGYMVTITMTSTQWYFLSQASRRYDRASFLFNLSKLDILATQHILREWVTALPIWDRSSIVEINK